MEGLLVSGVCKMDYRKLPLTTEQHIALLKQRGLVIDDDVSASHYINKIGYYRLSAYFIPFEQANKNRLAPHHFFKSDVHFSQVLALYLFDRKLRLIIMEGIETIEVSLRTMWANGLTNFSHDPHAFMEVKHFRDPWQHQMQLARISGNLASSSEVFVTHYKKKYTRPFLPPLWAIVETMTLGELSKWLTNTRNTTIKKRIGQEMGIPSIEVLQSVMQSIALIRNLCAHHARLWNRRLLKPLPNIKHLKNLMQTEESTRQSKKELFNYLVVMCHIMKHIQTTPHWKNRLTQHIAILSTDQQSAMGFPDEWQKQDMFMPNNLE